MTTWRVAAFPPEIRHYAIVNCEGVTIEITRVLDEHGAASLNAHDAAFAYMREHGMVHAREVPATWLLTPAEP